MVLTFFRELENLLQRQENAVLMVVIQNRGSSPGRKGFKMAVSANNMAGSIGGGNMEFRLVEFCRELLKNGPFAPFLKKQIHRKNAGDLHSGLICSGEQTVAFYYCGNDNWSEIEKIASGRPGVVCFTETGFLCSDSTDENSDFLDHEKGKWRHEEAVFHTDTVYVIGGGHVSRALCEIVSKLDVNLEVFDDRAGLNTLEANPFAHKKHIVSFHELEKFIPQGPHSFVVIMTFGFPTDLLALERLAGRTYRFLGVMGSREKVRLMLEELRKKGFSEEILAKITAPVGIPIKSETPHEIAISVAAQLIQLRNRANE